MTDPNDPVMKELKALRREVNDAFYLTWGLLLVCVFGLAFLSTCK